LARSFAARFTAREKGGVMADILKERQAFCNLFSDEHRARVQMVAAILRLCWPGAKHLTNEQILDVAATNLESMAFTDLKMQEEDGAAIERELRIEKLMKLVKAGKPQ
jgi:hypothetical protein